MGRNGISMVSEGAKVGWTAENLTAAGEVSLESRCSSWPPFEGALYIAPKDLTEAFLAWEQQKFKKLYRFCLKTGPEYGIYIRPYSHFGQSARPLFNFLAEHAKDGRIQWLPPDVSFLVILDRNGKVLGLEHFEDDGAE